MNRFSKLTSFLREVRVEVRKVVWPARAELIGSSVIVCMLAIFFAVVLGGMDSIFHTIIGKIIS